MAEKQGPEMVAITLESMDQGITMLDANLGLVTFNRKFLDVYGIPEGIFERGDSFESVLRYIAERGDFGEGDPEEQVSRRLALFRGTEPHAFRRRRPDGTEIEIHGVPLPDGGFLIAYTDVTERRRVEQALRDSEQRYGLVIQAMAEGIYEWNIESGELFISPRLRELLKLASDRLGPEEWNARVHPDDFEGYVDALREHFRGRTERLEYQYRIRDHSGEYIWFADRGIAVRNEAGRAVRLVGAVTDVTASKEAERALNEAQERYDLAIEAMGESPYDWHVDTGDVYYSPRLYAVLGFSEDDLRTPDDWIRLIHPEDLPGYRRAVAAHFKGNTERFEHTYRYRAPGGDWRWARQHGLAVRDASGRAVRMAGSTGDVTEQKETEKALQVARAQLDEAIEAISEGFALFNADDEIVLCNSVYRSFFAAVEGLSEMVRPGTHFETFIRAGAERGMFPDLSGDVETWVAAVLEQRRDPRGTREQHLAGDLWLQISDHRTSDGGLVSVYTDVSELKRREQELSDLVDRVAEARTRLTEAIESISEGFVLYDADDRLVLRNDRMVDFYREAADLFTPGRPFEEVLRGSIERGLIREANPDPEEWVAIRLEQHRSPPTPWEFQVNDGRWIQISERKTQDGSVVGVYTDITELKRREAQLAELVDNLARARDEAMEASRTKSRFLASMSHELRTPLNAVIGITEMLQEDAEAEGIDDFREPLERISRAGRHLLDLISDVLDLSKIEAGKVELQVEEIDVALVVRDAASTVAPLADRNRSRIRIDCAPDVGTLRADLTRVRQVVLNLLSNACKFTEDGEIVVSAARETVGGRAEVVLRVRDTGIGMDEDILGRLFQEFSQAEGTGKFGGTGLGLAISRRLCRLMGGDIEASSRSGAGSTFTVRLPAGPTATETTARAGTDPVPALAGGAEPERGPGDA